MADSDSNLLCSIDSCLKPVQAKGFCSMHYWKAHRYGDPLVSRTLRRVVKACGWCSKPMSLRPSIATIQNYCCRSCGQNARNEREGKWSRETKLVCKGCSKSVVRHVRSSKDSGEFCSRDCYFKSITEARLARLEKKRVVRLETTSLRAIGRGVRAKQKELDRLARKVVRVTVTCPRCQCTHEITGSAGRKLKRCDACVSECKRVQAKKSRQSPSGRAARKRAKTLRRVKYSIASEAIDPIAVFERDGWRCHICRKPTPKKLRGTYEDDAPELDHVISLAEGGDHTWSNVACSCRRCNGLKGSRSMGQLNMPWAA